MRAPWPSTPYPLGARWDGRGTRFSVFSRVAERVDLVLLDARGAEERVHLPERSGDLWHGYLPDVGPGQRYGFAIYGPWAPERGHCCDPKRVVLDPYARLLEPMKRPPPAQLLSRVVDERFDWGDDAAPRTPWTRTVLYETHVVGFTKRLEAIPPELRGTFAGLAHPAAIEHLVRLGVTAVELLPIQAHVSERHLQKLGLRNYWGYSTIGFFAPHPGYAHAPDDAVAEVKGMVKALHAAGIEVLLDVVFNHTGEEGPDGPVYSFRGIDNAAYYRLDPDVPAEYVDYTGTGNTLDVREPVVMQLVMDALRYWAGEIRVDGFRFDLAPALGRDELGGMRADRMATFFQTVEQDPLLQRVKLIAEPWDLGDGGYQLGGFPALWSEWNDRFRDTVRAFWRGDAGLLPDLGRRLTGSRDLYASRSPRASIAFVAAHDGFTTRDLVSYAEKHNEANGEENRDGHDHNLSTNHGVEGPSDDPAVREARDRHVRSLLTTVFLAQGVPMLLAGDELGRTQGGNNNAYCQDNETSWLDWENADAALLDYVRRLIAFRKAHPALRRRRWLRGTVQEDGYPDARWYRPDGGAMQPSDWEDPARRAVALFLNGAAIDERAPDGGPLVDDDLLLLLNAEDHDVHWIEPGELGDGWQLALASTEPARDAMVPARSVCVLLRAGRTRAPDADRS
ncbi:MAG: glycogen debranching protein GlgX [Myxococcota bacterium]